MNVKQFYLFCLTILAFTSGCKSQPASVNYLLTAEEKRICDSLQLDSSIVKDLRLSHSGSIVPFTYSPGRLIPNSEEIPYAPVFLQEIVVKEENAKSMKLVMSLKDQLKKKGYTIFILDSYFNIDNKKDEIGIVKTTDKYAILKQVGTDGINHDITNDSLISIIKTFDSLYSLELIAASEDWCEFIIHKEPRDWAAFAEEVYSVCPDVVDQGAETVEALATEMKKTKRLYFWWD